jgi:hypothetical protein
MTARKLTPLIHYMCSIELSLSDLGCTLAVIFISFAPWELTSIFLLCKPDFRTIKTYRNDEKVFVGTMKIYYMRHEIHHHIVHYIFIAYLFDVVDIDCSYRL